MALISDAVEHRARFSLAGRLAVVTGARRGVGLAIAEALAAAGADIVGVSAAIDPGGGAVRERVEAQGRRFRSLSAALGDRDAVRALIARLEELDRPIDILIVDGSRARRIAELLRQILDADEPVADGDRVPDLESVLGATEQRAREIPQFIQCGGVRLLRHDLRIVDQRAWTDLLGDMIAAGGVRCLPARIPWPMHRAVRLLYEEAGRTGRLGALPPAPVFAACPETGLAAIGADEALRSLIRGGLIREEAAGLRATLVMDDAQLVDRRRALMGRDASAVALLQRAGERWAAFASTAANTSASAANADGATVASATA
jgi:NAD(P)-dependent dehydrogenase (short-subunit alcohol dehydrogenase family)